MWMITNCCLGLIELSFASQEELLLLHMHQCFGRLHHTLMSSQILRLGLTYWQASDLRSQTAAQTLSDN